MGQREHLIEEYLDKRVTEVGGITRKWVSPGRTGVPDQIVFLKSEIIFVEVKTVDGQLSVAQVREHHRLRAAGAKVVTVYGKAGVDDFLKGYI